jgi:nucleolysin TIA-1/TIAR
VYCGGLTESDDDHAIRRAFSSFGRIVDVRYFRDKGFAFVKFDNKESACNAIVALHGKQIGSGPNTIKCSWGKESHGAPRGPLIENAALAPALYAPHPAQQQAVFAATGIPPQYYDPYAQQQAAAAAAAAYYMPLAYAQPPQPQYYIPNPGYPTPQQW